MGCNGIVEDQPSSINRERSDFESIQIRSLKQERAIQRRARFDPNRTFELLKAKRVRNA